MCIRDSYTPEARALKEENAANWIERDPEVKCYMPGVPRATYIPMPFQIIQSERDVFIAYQFAGAVRDIYMDNPGSSQVVHQSENQEEKPEHQYLPPPLP